MSGTTFSQLSPRFSCSSRVPTASYSSRRSSRSLGCVMIMRLQHMRRIFTLSRPGRPSASYASVCSFVRTFPHVKQRGGSIPRRMFFLRERDLFSQKNRTGAEVRTLAPSPRSLRREKGWVVIALPIGVYRRYTRPPIIIRTRGRMPSNPSPCGQHPRPYSRSLHPSAFRGQPRRWGCS